MIPCPCLIHPPEPESRFAHEGDGVAFFDHAGVHAVVERHAAVLEVILEMDVDGQRREDGVKACEGQIVRGEKADGARVQQAAHHGFGANSAIVGIRPLQQLVEQKE